MAYAVKSCVDQRPEAISNKQATSPAYPKIGDDASLMCSFVTFEDDSAVEKVFTAGTMHDISGKRVEVKTATPRGSGPIGRGAAPGGTALHI